MASVIDRKPLYPTISDFPLVVYPNTSDLSSKQHDLLTCDATALQWAGLILTVLSISVSWWLLELPLLWERLPTSPPFPSSASLGRRIRRFLDSVSWQCLRCHMPSFAAILALSMTGEPREIAFIYYRGPLHLLWHADPEDRRQLRRLSLLQMAVAVVVDLATVGTAVTIATTVIDDRGGAGSTVSEVTNFNSSGWLSPALSIAVCGLWLLLCWATRWSRRWIVLGGFLLIVSASCAIILPLALPGRQEYVY